MNSHKRIGSTLVLILAAIARFAPASAHAHGEDQLGPHGGEIRMPGAFHTELKLRNKRTVTLYLLDMEWKNPVIENSSLTVTFIRATAKLQKDLACTPAKSVFECSLPENLSWKSGDELRVLATRAGQAGIPVSYHYPFGHKP